MSAPVLGKAPFLALALLAGCVALPPNAGRDDVERDLGERLGTPLTLPPDASGAALREVLADDVLDADEAVRLAVANNSRLRSILADLDVARAELWQASLAPNPVVDAEVQFVESGGGDLLELTVAQDIVDVLLIPRRRQVASERFEQVEAEVTAAVLDLATEVRTAYRTLQAQLELVELFRAASDATWLSFDAARRLREAGNIRELDVLRERVLHEETRVALVEARTAAYAQRENLNALLGLWGPQGAAWSVEPRLPVPEPLDVAPDDLERRVLDSSLDLRSMHHEVTALGQAAGLERIEAVFPEGSAGVKAEREADETWSVGPLTSVSVPVFDFGRAAGAKARARVEQAYERYTDLAVRIRSSARSAYVRSEATANESRYLLEVVVPLRARITEQTQLQFNAMQLGVFQLLDARRAELDAGRRYVESLREHWIARTRLEALLLGRLPQARFGIMSAGGGSMGDMPAERTSGGHR